MSITMPDRAARLLDLAPTPIGPPPAEPPGEPRDHQGEGGSYRSYAKADSAARWVAQETGESVTVVNEDTGQSWTYRVVHGSSRPRRSCSSLTADGDVAPVDKRR